MNNLELTEKLIEVLGYRHRMPKQNMELFLKTLPKIQHLLIYNRLVELVNQYDKNWPDSRKANLVESINANLQSLFIYPFIYKYPVSIVYSVIPKKTPNVYSKYLI